MKEIASLNFRDLQAECSAFASVRTNRKVVVLVLSLETNGDLELCFTPDLARQLAAALEDAASHAEMS